MTRYYRAHLSRPPSLLVVGGGVISGDQKEWVQPVDKWSMFYYLHSGVLTIGTRVYPFNPGSVSIIPPGRRCEHNKVLEGTDCRWHTFDLPGGPADPVGLPVMSHLPEDRFRAIVVRGEEMVLSITRTINWAAAYIWDVLWSLSRPPEVLRSSPHLFDAESYIREHLAENLKVESLAAEIGISQTHLLRLFRQEHGTTIQQFIRDLRVNEARRLLTTTAVPIKEIAHRVGFLDPQHFNKVIRWNTGYSPSALRAGISPEIEAAEKTW